ncbi:hypothetical protein C8F01DRAFT_303793 [Mycena amicta]|nr:hypothetical protein C8F01DRAFT_303793 [Mycena amicta]
MKPGPWQKGIHHLPSQTFLQNRSISTSFWWNTRVCLKMFGRRFRRDCRARAWRTCCLTPALEAFPEPLLAAQQRMEDIKFNSGDPDDRRGNLVSVTRWARRFDVLCHPARGQQERALAEDVVKLQGAILRTPWLWKPDGYFPPPADLIAAKANDEKHLWSHFLWIITGVLTGWDRIKTVLAWKSLTYPQRHQALARRYTGGDSLVYLRVTYVTRALANAVKAWIDANTSDPAAKRYCERFLAAFEAITAAAADKTEAGLELLGLAAYEAARAVATDIEEEATVHGVAYGGQGFLHDRELASLQPSIEHCISTIRCAIAILAGEVLGSHAPRRNDTPSSSSQEFLRDVRESLGLSPEEPVDVPQLAGEPFLQRGVACSAYVLAEREEGDSYVDGMREAIVIHGVEGQSLNGTRWTGRDIPPPPLWMKGLLKGPKYADKTILFVVTALRPQIYEFITMMMEHFTFEGYFVFGVPVVSTTRPARSIGDIDLLALANLIERTKPDVVVNVNLLASKAFMRLHPEFVLQYEPQRLNGRIVGLVNDFVPPAIPYCAKTPTHGFFLPFGSLDLAGTTLQCLMLSAGVDIPEQLLTMTTTAYSESNQNRITTLVPNDRNHGKPLIADAGGQIKYRGYYNINLGLNHAGRPVYICARAKPDILEVRPWENDRGPIVQIRKSVLLIGLQALGNLARVQNLWSDEPDSEMGFVEDDWDFDARTDRGWIRMTRNVTKVQMTLGHEFVQAFVNYSASPVPIFRQRMMLSFDLAKRKVLPAMATKEMDVKWCIAEDDSVRLWDRVGRRYVLDTKGQVFIYSLTQPQGVSKPKAGGPRAQLVALCSHVIPRMRALHAVRFVLQWLRTQ